MNNLNLTWKNISNCQKIFHMNFFKCADIADSIGYDYMCFNGKIHSTNSAPHDYVMLEEELDSIKG